MSEQMNETIPEEPIDIPIEAVLPEEDEVPLPDPAPAEVVLDVVEGADDQRIVAVEQAAALPEADIS